ncbi:hypothetical protein [Lyngbya aestuarii]
MEFGEPMYATRLSKKVIVAAWISLLSITNTPQYLDIHSSDDD